MTSCLARIQCAAALTLERIDNMRSQTLGSPVLKGKKVRKTSRRAENETHVEVRKG